MDKNLHSGAIVMTNSILESIRLSILVCAVAIIGQPSVARFPQSNAWQRYKAEGSSVLLPEQPTTMEIALTTKSLEKQRTARLFTAYEDQVAFVILAFDNPKHRDPLSRFINEIETYSTSAKAERFQQDLSGAGFTGKEYGFGSAPTHIGVVRFYLAADRVYMLEAIGDDGTKPSVKQFLDSFSVGSDGSAKEISSADSQDADHLPIFRPEPATTPPTAGVFAGKDVTSKARV